MNKRVNLDSPELADNLRSSGPRAERVVRRRQPRRSFNVEETTVVSKTSLDVALEEIEPVPEDLVEEEQRHPVASEETAPEPTVAHLATEAKEAVAVSNFKFGVLPNTKQGWMLISIVVSFLIIFVFSMLLFRTSDNPAAPVLSATDLNEEISLIENLRGPIDKPGITPVTASELEVAPTLDSYASYSVQNNRPRLLHIDSLDIAATVESVERNSDSNILLPENTYSVGWFDESRNATASKGVMLMVGHASGYNSSGVFAELGQLKRGNEIIVERGDGQKLTFEVKDLLFHEHGEEDMMNAQIPRSFDKLSLVLLSCDCRSDNPVEEKDRSVLIRAEIKNSSGRE